MPRVHKSIDIKAPVSKVFSYIQDPRNEPEWMQGMIEIKDITGKGRGFQYKWTWKMAGIKLNGEAERLEDIPNQKIVDKSKGAIESTRTYNFETHGEITHLDLDVDYKIPIPVVGKMAENIIRRQNEREAEVDMQNIKDKLES
jgi:uncharacterized membrane protein